VSSHLAKVLNKAPIKTRVPKKGSNLLDWLWRWKTENEIYLGFVHFNTLPRDDMSENNSLFDHEITLFLVKGQVFLSTPLKDQV